MEKSARLELEKSLQSPLLWDEPMARHTSWRIGGPADVLVMPQSIDDLGQVLACAHAHQIPLHVIGNGTNLLVADAGIRGIVVKIAANLGRIRTRDNLITAQAGVLLPRLAAAAMEARLAGFEFLAGIPGTVGGAVMMNAGANGSTAGQLLQWVTVLDHRGQQHVLDARALAFNYRSSDLKHQNYVVAEACLAGMPGLKEQIKQKTAVFLARRRQTQPLQYPNAGSVFKNPPGLAAGHLIEQAGCKGMRVGAIEVSDLHANFFINRGGGSARDVLTLMQLVQQKVQEQFGCLLMPEVLKLGEF